RLDVSLHRALIDRPALGPDGVGCVLEPPDAVHHAGVRRHLRAPHPGLHRLGLSRHVGQGAPARHHPWRPRLLIADPRFKTAERNPVMWYFAWMLGLPLAAAFAILNAMWFELMEDEAERASAAAGTEPRQPS